MLGLLKRILRKLVRAFSKADTRKNDGTDVQDIQNIDSATRCIKFQHKDFDELRKNLLANLKQENFCVLLGKKEAYPGGYSFNVIEPLLPTPESHDSSSLTHVSPKKDFIHSALKVLQERCDVDTIIDVHTHPFAKEQVAFSSIDDGDEQEFTVFLGKNLQGINYGSIVLSQNSYDARIWEMQNDSPIAHPASIRTQAAWENIQQSNSSTAPETVTRSLATLNRTVLALGVDTMSKITSNSSIVIVGVGGLGSIIAENLVHMGFKRLVLIDPDTIEHTNLNRIVGAGHKDADQKRLKVQVVKEHLDNIMPDLDISEIGCGIEKIEEVVGIDSRIAEASFIVVATDNHLSRFKAQRIAFRYFIPLVSVGVNISVDNGKVVDSSGEVVVAKMGDHICLSCLGILNPTNIAANKNQGNEIEKHLINKGYVTGEDVKQPAVKTLNSIIASLAVDEIVNMFSKRHEGHNIVVYDNTKTPKISIDSVSQRKVQEDCIFCDI